MPWNISKATLAIGVLATLVSSAAPAEEASTLLRWRNGDVLSGKLLESAPGQVRWSSPRFLDELAVDAAALDSIIFPNQPVLPEEAFRVGTVFGDVWTADLIGSDQTGFLFSSERYGEVRVDRDAVYSLDRCADPNLVFDGSQFSAWTLSQDGPIRDLTYKVYEGHWTPGYPDFLNQPPLAEGRLAAGYLDIRLTDLTDLFAIVFEGLLETTVEGEYTFEISVDDQARVSVDGQRIIDTENRGSGRAKVRLGVGSHAFRLDYLEYGSSESLKVWWTGPGFDRQPLFGTNQVSGWRQGLGGFAETRRRQAGIFWPMHLPDPLVMNLAFESTGGPRFVLALGPDESNVGTSPDSLRLETWDNELVVVQDKIFEPVMTIGEGQRDVTLRLALDGETHELRVFDATGRSLVMVQGIQFTAGDSGIYLRNRGEDLTIRRLSVYRHSDEQSRLPSDSTRSSVHLMNGQVIYGQLFVDERGAQVMDQDGAPRAVDLNQIVHLARPDLSLMAAGDVAELSYADGAVVRGRIVEMSAEQVTLQTAFAESPVRCSLAGASLLRLGSPGPDRTPTSGQHDEFFSGFGRLLGRLSFDSPGAPLSWGPEGVAQPLRLANIGAVRLELHPERVLTGSAFDTNRFPQVLHLKNGEILPGKVVSYDEANLEFESPFLKGQRMDSGQVKAIAFRPMFNPEQVEEPTWWSRSNEREIDTFWLPRQLSSEVDTMQVERALTVPRFIRENPPTHLLVANNGDLKRGRLLAINGSMVRFESKLRVLSVPVDRLALLVNISKPGTDSDPPVNATDLPEGAVRANLSDGSILVFEPADSRDGQLLGRSAVYGETAIPTQRIQRVTFGEGAEPGFESLFEEWVVRQAQEPDFGGQPTSP